MFKFDLGDTLKCKHTGVKGVAVTRTEFINGCIQYDLARKLKKDGTLPEPVGIDQQSLVLVSKRKLEKKKKVSRRTGGSNTKGNLMRGF